MSQTCFARAFRALLAIASVVSRDAVRYCRLVLPNVHFAQALIGARRPTFLALVLRPMTKASQVVQPYFTRETWRRGKRRATHPRVKPWGGHTVANEAFLAAARAHAIGGPLDKRPRCTGVRFKSGLPCRGLAMNGSTFCMRHGGAQGARRVRPYVAKWGERRASKGDG